ncbi:dihydropteroate synthase [Pajaroellobacter abortibovis]|uniref:dihydropteroate synthase n=1 Tax=Pajaroellobacter abortibovis TaxID=1882918 RepID=A0A1L6MW84_9BACT|nr:dihydropteroate synthase [Pajaroellobacter abortibovis]APR99697.1 dihydropteroate synthase [Pajaroellobacter abortibovis]
MKLDAFHSVCKRAKAQRGVVIVGVCNVTPDSYSDGGEFLHVEQAQKRVDVLIQEGADIVEIGADSSRPGSEEVSASVQLERLAHVVRYAVSKIAVSIDTMHPNVADFCLREGALAVNDVSCLARPALADVVVQHHACLMLVHARGSQADMKGFSQYEESAYGDIVREVLEEWESAAKVAQGRGLRRDALVMDPGFGFAKSAQHSMTLLKRLDRLTSCLDVPVLIGASRKSFLTLVDEGATPRERLGASLAAAWIGIQKGAALVRVHDVRDTKQAIDLMGLMRE